MRAAISCLSHGGNRIAVLRIDHGFGTEQLRVG
jgi:hypothetical protein